MGKQFTYYCLPEDLEKIQRVAIDTTGGELFATENETRKNQLTPVKNFNLDLEEMGNKPLKLLLMPPEHLRHIVHSGEFVDTFNSHLIEVSRCYTDGIILRQARFWHEPSTFSGEQFGTKPDDFIAWCNLVYRKAKSTLRKQTFNRNGHIYEEWFGDSAWRQVSCGALTPVT